MLENQSGKSVKRVRTDNGGEFINNQLSSYYRQRGIKPEPTQRYSPQQNGKAERLNRVLLERVRTMLVQSGISQQYWGEAMYHANYIRNRSPYRNNAMTPTEAFSGQKPDVSNLKPFGCEAWVHVPAQLRNKLDAVSQRGVYIGVDRGTGSVVLLRDGTITTSRDVIFSESVFPAQGSSNSCTSWSAWELLFGPDDDPAAAAVAASGDDQSGADEPSNGQQSGAAATPPTAVAEQAVQQSATAAQPAAQPTPATSRADR